MPPSWTVEEKMVNRLLIRLARRTERRGCLVDSEEVFGQWDVSGPELDQYAGLSPAQLRHELAEPVGGHQGVYVGQLGEPGGHGPLTSPQAMQQCVRDLFSG